MQVTRKIAFIELNIKMVKKKPLHKFMWSQCHELLDSVIEQAPHNELKLEKIRILIHSNSSTLTMFQPKIAEYYGTIFYWSVSNHIT